MTAQFGFESSGLSLMYGLLDHVLAGWCSQYDCVVWSQTVTYQDILVAKNDHIGSFSTKLVKHLLFWILQHGDFAMM